MILNKLQLQLGLKCLPSGLKVLAWKECHLESLLIGDQSDELVDLDMCHSKIKHLWKGTKVIFFHLNSRSYLILRDNMYMQVRAHARAHTHTHTHTHTHARAHTQTHVCVYRYSYTYVEFGFTPLTTDIWSTLIQHLNVGLRPYSISKANLRGKDCSSLI